MKNLAFVIMGLLLWSCSPQPKVDVEAEKAALMSIAKSYQDACSVLDVEKIVSFYSGDAKVIPPDGEIVTGTDNIHRFMAGFKELNNFQARFESPDIEISSNGDMGYSLAEAVLSWEDADGHAISEAVRDFHVWKKVDGMWKLAIDIWNSPPSPESAPAEENN